MEVAPKLDVADAIVTKWSRLATTFDQALKRLRQGIARDRTPPAISVQKTMAQIDDYLARLGPFDRESDAEKALARIAHDWPEAKAVPCG